MSGTVPGARDKTVNRTKYHAHIPLEEAEN